MKESFHDTSSSFTCLQGCKFCFFPELVADLGSDDRCKEILSPLLFSQDLMLSKHVAQVILQYDDDGNISPQSKVTLAKYMKTHIEALLTNVGMTLEEMTTEVKQDTVVYKGRRYQGSKTSYITCTASLPLNIRHFEDLRAGTNDNIRETIQVMNQLRTQNRSKNIVDILAYSDYDHGRVCFYIVELDTHSPKTVWNITNDPKLELVPVLVGVLDAVRFAHSCGVVLRSLSPDAFLYVDDSDGHKTVIFHHIEYMRTAKKYLGEYFLYPIVFG